VKKGACSKFIKSWQNASNDFTKINWGSLFAVFDKTKPMLIIRPGLIN
jgi:hypothetical protein